MWLYRADGPVSPWPARRSGDRMGSPCCGTARVPCLPSGSAISWRAQPICVSELSTEFGPDSRECVVRCPREFHRGFGTEVPPGRATIAVRWPTVPTCRTTHGVSAASSGARSQGSRPTASRDRPVVAPASSSGPCAARRRASGSRAGSWPSPSWSPWPAWPVPASSPGVSSREPMPGRTGRPSGSGSTAATPTLRRGRSCPTSTPRGCSRCSRRGRSCPGTWPGSSGGAGRSSACSGRSTGRIAAVRSPRRSPSSSWPSRSPPTSTRATSP